MFAFTEHLLPTTPRVRTSYIDSDTSEALHARQAQVQGLGYMRGNLKIDGRDKTDNNGHILRYKGAVAAENVLSVRRCPDEVILRTNQ